MTIKSMRVTGDISPDAVASIAADLAARAPGGVTLGHCVQRFDIPGERPRSRAIEVGALVALATFILGFATGSM